MTKAAAVKRLVTLFEIKKIQADNLYNSLKVKNLLQAVLDEVPEALSVARGMLVAPELEYLSLGLWFSKKCGGLATARRVLDALEGAANVL